MKLNMDEMGKWQLPFKWLFNYHIPNEIYNDYC